ncbi:hypothetical protein PENSPDRAFT_670900 [Peniophora sp. CONT]|nr:hypothetical protein PENSPDRAFT_670900 [Peniophora sp. CONT]
MASSSPNGSQIELSKEDGSFQSIKWHLVVVPYLALFTKQGNFYSILWADSTTDFPVMHLVADDDDRFAIGYVSDNEPAQKSQTLHGHNKLISNFSRFEAPLSAKFAGKRQSKIPALMHDDANILLFSLSTHGIIFEEAALVLDNSGGCKKIFTTPALADHLCAGLMSTQCCLLALKHKLREMEDLVTPSTKKVACNLQPATPIASSSCTPSLSNISFKESKGKDKDSNSIDVFEFTDSE